jgi:hypothetical protein
MGSGSAGKRAIVICDNELLFKAIEVNLHHRLGMEAVGRVFGPEGFQGTQVNDGDFDLIVVALSSPASEPTAALVAASLLGQMSDVPLLTISDMPLESLLEAEILHLGFPFSPDGLQNRVEETLRRRVA